MSVISTQMKDNLQEVCNQLASLYESTSIEMNPSLLRQLSNPMSIEEQDMNDNLKSINRTTTIDPSITDNSIDLIFRGNYKLNFSNRLQDKDLLLLIQVITNIDRFSDKLRHIDLSYNNLTDNSVGELISLCRKAPNVKSLNLQANSISSQSAEQLGMYLQENDNLIYLNLDSNQIGTEGAMSLVEMLFTNKGIREINLNNNDIDADGVIAITSVLNFNNRNLVAVSLNQPSYPGIGQETAIHFGKMLQSNRDIEKLSLLSHGFTCEAIYTMSEHLLENNKLRVLDLSSNRLGFKGCEALSKYLQGEYCGLESLILNSNRTGHYGAKAMAQALEKNRTLIHLDMQRNDIDDNGVKMLAESLHNNDTLMSLKLYWNAFGQMGMKAFDLLTHIKPNHYLLDFVIYQVDHEYQFAMLDVHVHPDLVVTRPYYVFNENLDLKMNPLS